MFSIRRASATVLLVTPVIFNVGPSLADPMQPDTVTAPTAPAADPEPSFRLTSIYRLDQRAYAVINGRWLELNDTIGNYELVGIRSDTVILQRGNQTRTLTLSKAGSLAITPVDEE